MPFIPFAATVGAWLGTSEAVGGAVIASVAASVAGAAVSTTSAIQQGKAQESMYKYQSDVAKRQQEMATQAGETNIDLTQDKAKRDTLDLQRKYALVTGAQRATRAAMGIGGGSVSEGDIATDTFNTKSLDETMIRYNADLKSWAIRNQTASEVWGLGTQANQYTYAGRNAARAGIISGTGTIFSAAGNLGMDYMRLKQ